MPALEQFHETRFPLDISIGAIGGPVRKTEIVSLVSGHEKRNTKWAHSRRNYNAGFGIKTIDDLQDVIAFFEERRGSLFGFRFRDPIDHKSCKPSQIITNVDQNIGVGDGSTTVFQLKKLYGTLATGYYRPINKPVSGSVKVAIDGTSKTEGSDYSISYETGELVFLPGSTPVANSQISAGYEYDVPVRFDADEISINLNAFRAGEIPSIPLIEVKI